MRLLRSPSTSTPTFASASPHSAIRCASSRPTSAGSAPRHFTSPCNFSAKPRSWTKFDTRCKSVKSPPIADWPFAAPDSSPIPKLRASSGSESKATSACKTSSPPSRKRSRLLGFERDPGPFTPHLTLARSGSGRPRPVRGERPAPGLQRVRDELESSATRLRYNDGARVLSVREPLVAGGTALRKACSLSACASCRSLIRLD